MWSRVFVALASILLTRLVYEREDVFINEICNTLIKLVFDEVYEEIKAAELRELELDRWRFKEPCPEWAARYGGEIPHGNYIASREGDIEQLRERFDSFKNVNNTVNVVYIYGVPGSGKSELARQFGNSFFCQQNGYSTVVTLNLGRQDEFRRGLAGSIFLIANKCKKCGKDIDELSLRKGEVSDLIHQLKTLLKNRPGWLLILDNINDPNITQNDIYREFLFPGTDAWGTGNMLITTQFNLEPAGEYVKYQRNKGMSPKDAKNFLCGLVKKDSTCCDTGVAENIVTKLEFLPLSILAASYKIDNTIKLTDSYSCRDYLSELSAALGTLPAHESSKTTTGYNHSMVTALNLTINNAREVYSNIFRDFIALIGFSVDGGTISTQLVQGYLELRGYKSKEYTEITNFPLVYFLEEKMRFQVHQVVSYVFREELQRSETYDLLENILKTIFSYYTDKFELHDMYYYEIIEHFSALMKNMPARCPDIHCLITPDTKRLDTVSALIFESYKYSLTENKRLNCSNLETYLWQLGHSSYYINRVPVHLRFTGYQAMYWCLTRQDKVNGPILAATKAIEIINEVTPRHSELHTVSVALFLLRGIDRNFMFGDLLFNQLSTFLLFPDYLNFSSNTSDIRRKLCLSLHEVTKILIPQQQEQIRKYCDSDFKDSTIRREKSSLFYCFKEYVADPFFYGSTQFKSTYYVSLGRSYRLEQHHGKTKKCARADNPFGACSVVEKDWRLIGIKPGKILQFYIDYDKRVGLRKIKIASMKYRAAFYFIKFVVDTQFKVNWKDSESTCQSLKIMLQTIMKKQQKTNFYKVFFLFVNNYCDSLPNLVPKKLFEIFYEVYKNTVEDRCLHSQVEKNVVDIFFNNYNNSHHNLDPIELFKILLFYRTGSACFDHQKIQTLIDQLIHITGLYQARTEEVTELLNEIIAAIIYVSTNDNFELGLECISSDRTAFDVVTGLRISEQNDQAMSGQNIERFDGMLILSFFAFISYILFLYVILRKFGFR